MDYKEEIEKILREAEGIDELRSQLDQIAEATVRIAKIASGLAVDLLNELASITEHLKPLTFEETLKLMPIFACVLEDAERGKETGFIKALLVIFSMGRAYEKYREIHGRSP